MITELKKNRGVYLKHDDYTIQDDINTSREAEGGIPSNTLKRF